MLERRTKLRVSDQEMRLEVGTEIIKVHVPPQHSDQKTVFKSKHRVQHSDQQTVFGKHRSQIHPNTQISKQCLKINTVLNTQISKQCLVNTDLRSTPTLRSENSV